MRFLVGLSVLLPLRQGVFEKRGGMWIKCPQCAFFVDCLNGKS